MSKRIIIASLNDFSEKIGKWLSLEGYEVIFIDNETNSEEMQNSEFQILNFPPSSFEGIKQALQYESDIFLPFSPDESSNLLGSLFAKKFFECNHIITRIKTETLSQIGLSSTFADICSEFLCPESELSKNLITTIQYSRINFLKEFFNKKISFIRVSFKNSTHALKLDFKHLKSLVNSKNFAILGVLRNNEFFDEDQEIILEKTDEILLVTNNENLSKVLNIFGCKLGVAKRIILIGDTSIRNIVAKEIEQNFSETQCIFLEENPEKAKQLAKIFPQYLVLNGSLLDLSIKPDSSITHASLLISISKEIQTNIISSIFATKLGIPHSISLISEAAQENFYDLLNTSGTINQDYLNISKIIPFLSYQTIENALYLGENIGTILEIEINSSSNILGLTAKELQQDGGRILFIERDGELLTPNPGEILNLTDRILIFVERSKTKLSKFLSRL